VHHSSHDNDPATLKLRIEVAKSVWNLQEAYIALENVTAYLQNSSGSPVTVSDPHQTLPQISLEATTYMLDPEASFFKLIVLSPSGDEVEYRASAFFSFVGGSFHLPLNPNESFKFRLGKIGPYYNAPTFVPPGYYSESHFKIPGRYRLRLILKNIYPISSPNGEIKKFVKVWTGELHSNTIEIELK
jgi:hypothetical protein